jgi:hypothetical protein
MQEYEDGLHPIDFHSRSFLPAERNYDTRDKELAGIVFGFKCSRLFFLGASHAIHVRTDHSNLQSFYQPRRQARWFGFLQDSGKNVRDLQEHCGKICCVIIEQLT